MVSLKNGGGIRAQIGTVSIPIRSPARSTSCPRPPIPDAGKPEGGVSQLDIENSLRFNNRLMVFDTTRAGPAQHPELGRRACRPTMAASRRSAA